MLHARYKKYSKGKIDVCDTTKAKTEAGKLSVEAHKKTIDVRKRYFEVCDYNETQVACKRLNTWSDEVRRVLFGESENQSTETLLQDFWRDF